MGDASRALWAGGRSAPDARPAVRDATKTTSGGCATWTSEEPSIGFQVDRLLWLRDSAACALWRACPPFSVRCHAPQLVRPSSAA
eukprot:6915940-Alexandrium_andersonii.AAC.1